MLARPDARVLNAMTVDVEDYFQVQAFASTIPRAAWETLEPRVEASVDRILAQFDRAGIRATFFTLGWVAERHRAMVRRIVACGHELASHGYDHVRVDTFDRAAFRADIARAKDILEQAGGAAVRGYRAPTFSIGKSNLWAFEELEATGHDYSSSVFPIRHDLYGMPDAPRFPFRPGTRALWELPMTTVRLGARNLPCAGGGYFRLLPYRLYSMGLNRVNARENQPGIFYFHPWEVDPDQPRVAVSKRLSRFRHYVGLSAMQARVDRALKEFRWDRMDQVFADLLGARAAA